MESPSALDIRVLGYTAVVVSIATTSNPQEQTFTASRLKRAYETRLGGRAQCARADIDRRQIASSKSYGCNKKVRC